MTSENTPASPAEKPALYTVRDIGERARRRRMMAAIQDTAAIDITFPARALLSGAVHSNADCIQAIAALPGDAFPVALRPIAEAVISLVNDARAVDAAGIYAEAHAQGAEGAGALIGELSGGHISCDPQRDSKTIREAYARAVFVEKARTLSLAAADMPLEEARHFICDLDLLESIPDPANILPIADVVNAPDPEPPLFSSGVYRQKLNLLIAESNTGKSFIAVQAALSLATGRGMLEAFAPKANGRALVLSGEDDAAVIRARLEAISAAHGTPWRDALDNGALSFVTAVTPLIEFDSESRATINASWRELERRARDYDLIVIDPLMSWFRMAKENDNASMGTLAQHLIGLAGLADCAVLLLHHSNKSGAKTLDQGATRGGNALPSAARWIGNVRGLSDEDAEKAEIAPGEAWKYVEFATSKNSYAGRIGTPVTLRREQGGALVDCDLRRERYGRIAEALAAALADSEARLTRREIAKGQGEIARKLRAHLRDEFGDLRTTDLESAVAYGLQFGLLKETAVNPGNGAGRPRMEVSPP